MYPDVGQGAARRSILWQQFFRRGLTDVDRPFYSHLIRWENTAWSLRFLAPDFRSASDPAQLEVETERALPLGWRQWGALARAQLIEMHTFLSTYLLCCQGDRVAMGHSVEVRYPFLDPEVFDLCVRLPARLRLRGFRDKVTLRRLGSRFLPPEIWQRPKKPYRAPMTTVFFGQRAPDYVDEMLSDSALARFGLADRTAAAKMVTKARAQKGRMSGEREEMALVGLLTLQLLAHFYLEGFAGRAEEASRKLDDCEPSVLEDRSTSPARSGT